MNNNITILSSSEYETREAWKKAVWMRVAECLASAESSEDIDEFLSMVMTKNERDQIVNRFAAIALLRDGKSYREIGELLWLSPQTISAIKKSFKVRGRYTSRHTRHQKDRQRPAEGAIQKDPPSLHERIVMLFDLPEIDMPIRHPQLDRALRNERWRFYKKKNF